MSSPLRAVLREPAFVRLWATGALLGSLRWMEVLAVGLYALAETGSAFVVALMLFARMAPLVVFGALTGAVADRVDRRMLLGIGVTLMASTSVALAMLSLSGALTLWHVAFGALLNGAVWTMEHPVRRALIHDVVGNTRLAAAISLDSASFNGTRMVGPLMGGTLYAALGMPGIYCAAIAFYLLALLCVLGVPRAGDGSARPAGPGLRADLAEGVRHVLANPALSAMMWVTVLANMFGFAYVSMVPVLGEQILFLDAPGIGALMSMEGVGAMLGALILSGRARAGQYWRIFLGGIATFMIMLLLFSQSSVVGLSMFALFVAGLGLSGFGVMQSTIVLDAADPAMRSRVMGVLAVCIGTGPLGVLALGAAAEHAGPATAVFVSGVLGLLALGLVVARWPALLRTAR